MYKIRATFFSEVSKGQIISLSFPDSRVSHFPWLRTLFLHFKNQERWIKTSYIELLWPPLQESYVPLPLSIIYEDPVMTLGSLR